MPEGNQRLLVDSHMDLAFNAVVLNRDLRLPIDEVRRRDGLNRDLGTPTVCFPELIRGGVKIVFGSLWANPCGNPVIKSGPCYSNEDEAYRQASEQLAYYEALEREDVVRIIRTRTDLESVLSPDSPGIGVVVLMEGADPIREPREVKEWFKRGVRIVGPAWRATRYCGGTGVPGPLTPDGRELLEEMDSVGMILDGSHFAEASFMEALDRFHGMYIVTHANSRVFTPTDRHLTDEMTMGIAKRGGVIGTVLNNAFLDGDWMKNGGKKDDITFGHVIRNMRHVREVVGDNLHTGIGSDMDGGFGLEGTPKEIQTIADLQGLSEVLLANGFSEEDVRNIFGQNWIRILSQALPS